MKWWVAKTEVAGVKVLWNEVYDFGRIRRWSLNKKKNREPGELCSVALALAIRATRRFTPDKRVYTGEECNLGEIAANCSLKSARESLAAILLG